MRRSSLRLGLVPTILACLYFPAAGLAASQTTATEVAEASTADASTDLRAVLAHYERVRVALLNDSLDGVSESTRIIDAGLDALHRDFDPAAAAVDASASETARELLAEARVAARTLADATELGATRDAFYELTKPLVRYRELMVGERPVVAYCPMARKSWLQPAGELGNPYHGQSMATCGSVVSDTPGR